MHELFNIHAGRAGIFDDIQVDQIAKGPLNLSFNFLLNVFDEQVQSQSTWALTFLLECHGGIINKLHYSLCTALTRA